MDNPKHASKKVSTALKVLALLNDRAPVGLSSHGMGLQIQDESNSLSVIIKTLNRDKYIEQVGKKGLRTAYWGLTDIGRRSLARRADTAAVATRWLRENLNYRPNEVSVLKKLGADSWQDVRAISNATELPVVAVRQALKTLMERGFIELSEDKESARLNANGARALVQVF